MEDNSLTKGFVERVLDGLHTLCCFAFIGALIALVALVLVYATVAIAGLFFILVSFVWSTVLS